MLLWKMNSMFLVKEYSSGPRRDLCLFRCSTSTMNLVLVARRLYIGYALSCATIIMFDTYSVVWLLKIISNRYAVSC